MSLVQPGRENQGQVVLKRRAMYYFSQAKVKNKVRKKAAQRVLTEPSAVAPGQRSNQKDLNHVVSSSLFRSRSHRTSHLLSRDNAGSEKITHSGRCASFKRRRKDFH